MKLQLIDDAGNIVGEISRDDPELFTQCFDLASLGRFPIAGVSTVDLDDIGVDASGYPDTKMAQLARYLNSDYMDNRFWVSLREIVIETMEKASW